MAGDEDRSPSDAPVGEVKPEQGDEPALAFGAADHGAAERPADSAGAAPRGDEPITRADPPRSGSPILLAVVGIIALAALGLTLYAFNNPPENPAIPALRAEVAALKEQVAAVPKVDLGPLEARMTALTADVAQLKTAVTGNAAWKDAIAPLDGRVADLDKQLSSVKGALAALPKVDLGPLANQVAGLGKRIDPLDGEIADLGKRIDPLGGQIADLGKRLVPLEAYFNAPKTGAAVTEARQNGSAAETRAAPIAVLAQGIEDAIPAGRPFDMQVKALGTLGVEPALLQPLDAVAVKGAATDAALTSDFDALQDAIVVAAAPVKTGTMFDRMMANAQSLVEVTKTGASSGGDADAVTSRIKADLQRGALAAAAAEWDHLPDASKAKSADWVARLKARIAAEGAARAIAAKAVAALAVAQQ